MSKDIKSERTTRIFILGLIARELGAEIKVGRQVKLSDSIYDALNESGYLSKSIVSDVCRCKGGPMSRSVTADFKHQVCDKCGKIAN